MEKAYLHLPIVLFVLCICGCNQKKTSYETNSIVTISIDPDNRENYYIDLSPYLDEKMEIVPLETSENCLLMQIKKTMVTDEFIFISDESRSGVFIFDRKGKFVKKIGNKGLAPGEFAFMMNFTLVNSDSVRIHDVRGYKYITYNINDETFSEVRYPKGLHHLGTISFDNIHYYISNYFISEFGSYNLYRVEQNKEYEPLIPFDKELAKRINWLNRNFSSKYNDKSLLIYPLNDTVYEVTKNAVKAAYKIEFSKRQIPANIIELETASITKAALKNRYILGLEYIQNTKDYILTYYSEDGALVFLIIDKKTLDYKIGGIWSISTFGTFSFADFNTNEKNELITNLEAAFLKESWEYWKDEKFSSLEAKKKLETIATNIKEDDNPVVFIFKFK